MGKSHEQYISIKLCSFYLLYIFFPDFFFPVLFEFTSFCSPIISNTNLSDPVEHFSSTLLIIILGFFVILLHLRSYTTDLNFFFMLSFVFLCEHGRQQTDLLGGFVLYARQDYNQPTVFTSLC